MGGLGAPMSGLRAVEIYELMNRDMKMVFSPNLIKIY